MTRMQEDLFVGAQDLLPSMIAWRRQIHANPELGFQEHETAAFIASVLDEMGVEYMTGIGGTGVVARAGSGPRAVGIRADMDALPIQEANEVSYASQNPGIMHACGHDTHVAMALGALALLKDRDLGGELRILFQPSEETCDDEDTHGAEAMIRDGALDKLDAVIALHVHNEVPYGKVAVLPGYALAGGNYFEATIFGKGGHDSLVHHTIDPIFLAAQVINAFHGIRSRRVDPTRIVAINLGSIHAGTVGNIVPDRVDFSGTIRVFEDDVRYLLHEEIRKAFEIARTLGGDYELDIKPGFASLYNDPGVCDVFCETITELFGPDALHERRPFMGVEDFAYMLREVPGVMIMLGSHSDESMGVLHNPRFDVDENIFAVGASILAGTAWKLLGL